MKQRVIALALTLTLLLAAAVSAFAVEPAAGSGETTPAAETQQAVDGAQGRSIRWCSPSPSWRITPSSP